jgi:hypothetical protein
VIYVSTGLLRAKLTMFSFLQFITCRLVELLIKRWGERTDGATRNKVSVNEAAILSALLSIDRIGKNRLRWLRRSGGQMVIYHIPPLKGPCLLSMGMKAAFLSLVDKAGHILPVDNSTV